MVRVEVDMKVYLDAEQQARLLYYESGFEQLHPILIIHKWMEERGWEYYQDYRCVMQSRDVYFMEFSDDKIAEMFMLKWL